MIDLTHTKIELSDDERALAKRRPSRTVFIGLVQFVGPRGRRYRLMRTSACLDADHAIREVEKIKSRRYKHSAFTADEDIVEVTFLGKVVE